MALRRQKATYIWVNIGSGNGLMPDGTKPLPEPMLTYHQLGRVAFTWWQYSLEMLTMSLIKRGLKITHLKSQPHLSGGNELNCVDWVAGMIQYIPWNMHMGSFASLCCDYISISWWPLVARVIHGPVTPTRSRARFQQNDGSDPYDYGWNYPVQTYNKAQAKVKKVHQQSIKHWHCCRLLVDSKLAMKVYSQEEYLFE